MIDPHTAIILAKICITGLKVGSSSLKGLFKWIRQTCQPKGRSKQKGRARQSGSVKALTLATYVGVAKRRRLTEVKRVAALIRRKPAVAKHTQRFAKGVCKLAGVSTFAEILEVDITETYIYETELVWDGDSCPGSPVDEEAWDTEELEDLEETDVWDEDDEVDETELDGVDLSAPSDSDGSANNIDDENDGSNDAASDNRGSKDGSDNAASDDGESNAGSDNAASDDGGSNGGSDNAASNDGGSNGGSDNAASDDGGSGGGSNNAASDDGGSNTGSDNTASDDGGSNSSARSHSASDDD